MHRRALLAVLGGSVAGTAGCTATDAPPETSPTETATDGNDGTDGGTPTETDDAGDGETDDGADGETDAPIDVELQQVEYVVHTYEPSSSRGVDPDDVVPEEEIPAALLDPLEEAREDRFETDSVSGDLLAAIDEFREYGRGDLKPYVELDGTNYGFDPRVPTFVAQLAEEEPDDYDEDRLLRNDERREVEPEAAKAFVDALTARGTHVPRAEYRRCVVPEAVEAFIEEYDYLEDQLGVARIETTVQNADPPYSIELRELTDGKMWGRPVVDESELDDELVAFFERALASEHRKPALSTPDRSRYFTDDLPEGVSDAYADVAGEYESPPYYRLGGTVYSIAIGEPRYDRIPVSVAVEEGDEPEEEDTGGPNREFALTVTPAPDEVDADVEGPYTFTSRGALPSALWILHDGERHLLNEPDGSGLGRRPDNQVLETVGRTGELSGTYAVPDELPEGTYVGRGSFGVSWGISGQTPGEHGRYPFEVEIEVEDTATTE